jgi:hypothetical protein
MKNEILIFCSLTLIYLLYIEFSPGMGNIWWRDNKLFLAGAVLMLTEPLYNKTLWYPYLWDLNFVVWCIVCILIRLVVKKLNDKSTREVDKQWTTAHMQEPNGNMRLERTENDQVKNSVTMSDGELK